MFKKKITSNWLISSLSNDLALIIHHTRKKDNLLKEIRTLVYDSNFKKSKSLCEALIPLALKEKSVIIAQTIIKYTHGDKSLTFIDLEFFLAFYKNKVELLQTSTNANFLKVAKTYKRTIKLEKRLYHLHLMIWKCYLSRDVKLFYHNFPKIISKIVTIKYTCENNYSTMMNVLPSKSVFRAYSNYLRVFVNDEKRAVIFEAKANVLDPESSTGGSDLGRINDANSYNNSLYQSLSQHDHSGTSSKKKIRKKIERMEDWNAFKLMQKHVSNTRPYSFYLSIIGLLFVFVICVTCIFTTFFVILTFENDFQSKDVTRSDISNIRLSLISSSHYLRVYQSLNDNVYSNNELYIGNFSDFQIRSVVMRQCQTLQTTSNIMYRNDIFVYSDFFLLKERLLESGMYFYKNYSLIDAFQTVSLRCLRLLHANYSCIRCSDDFKFIIWNEKVIFERFILMLSRNYHMIGSHNYTYDIILYSIPCVCFLMIFIFGIFYIFLIIEQTKSFKIFKLISREIGVKMYHKYNKLSRLRSSKQTDVRSQSIITSFIIRGCGLIIVLSIVLLTYSIFVLIVYLQFDSLNGGITQDYVNLMKSNIRRIHYSTFDYLHPLDSLHEESEIKEELFEELRKVNELYHNIRDGNDELHLPAIGKIDEMFEMFNDNSCDVLTYNYNCYSMNNLVGLYSESVEHILHLNFSVNNDVNVIRRKYTILKELDDPIISTGALQDKISGLSTLVTAPSISIIKIVSNFSYLLLALIAPSFIVFYIFYIVPSPAKIKRFINEPKRLIMTLPRKYLYESRIFEYVTGEVRFLKAFKKGKSNRVDEVMEIMNNLFYPIAIFNRKYNLFYVNEKLSSLFGFSATISPIGKCFLLLFDDESANEIKKFVKDSTNKSSFSKELTATCRDQLFNVLVSISCYDNKYFCVVENIELTKRKEILSLVEKRTQKTKQILQKILPKDIVSEMSINSILSNDDKKEKRELFQSIHEHTTSIFMDLVNFTKISTELNPEKIITILDTLFSKIDAIAKENLCEKIKTIGDCYFAICGAPGYIPLHQEYAMKFAIKSMEYLKVINKEHGINLLIRAGLASGRVISGVIGDYKFCWDVWGPCVNLAARMESTGIPGAIQVSRDTFCALHKKYTFMERKVNVKGVGVGIKVYVHFPKEKSVSITNSKKIGSTKKIDVFDSKEQVKIDIEDDQKKLDQKQFEINEI